MNDEVLVLFDIDGTLIHTGGAGVRGFAAAIESVYGHKQALDGVSIAGRTDRAILSDAFASLGLPWSQEALLAVREAYLGHLAQELVRPLPAGAGAFGVIDGVLSALAALDADPRFTVALLTGNFAGGAEIKLRHFDLWQRFRFGAFGDAHVNRRDLVPLALAEARGRGASSPRVVIIGDTPLDVDCARANGVAALAVATGHYSAQDLAEAGADLVVSSLNGLDVQNLARLARASA